MTKDERLNRDKIAYEHMLVKNYARTKIEVKKQKKIDQ